MKKLFCNTIILVTISVICNCIAFTPSRRQKIYTIDKPLHFDYRGQHFVLGMSRNDVLKIQKDKLYYIPVQEEKSYIILHTNDVQVDQIGFGFDNNDILYSMILHKKGTRNTYYWIQNGLTRIYGLYHKNTVRNISGIEILETNWYFNNKKYYITITFDPIKNLVSVHYTDFEKFIKISKGLQ